MVVDHITFLGRGLLYLFPLLEPEDYDSKSRTEVANELFSELENPSEEESKKWTLYTNCLEWSTSTFFLI